jgi:uncharacterized protein (DUF1684 family)
MIARTVPAISLALAAADPAAVKEPEQFRAKHDADPIDLKSDENGPADQVAVAGVSLWGHTRGDRRTIRMRDVNGEPARTFAGFTWFPIESKYRATARFAKDAAPKQVQIPNQLGARILAGERAYPHPPR